MAKASCRISSYLQIMNMSGYHPLTSVELALKGQAVRILEENR